MMFEYIIKNLGSDRMAANMLVLNALTMYRGGIVYWTHMSRVSLN